MSAGAPDRERSRFFAASMGATLAVSLALLIRALVYTGGHLVYVIDDPAIHLAIARNLVEHGTWGVSPGVFEPASSAPLWTLMLAGVTRVARPTASVAPFVANLAAAAWILWLFASGPRATRLTRGAWGSWAVALLLPIYGLFLPGLAFTGMEHTLHAAIALQTLVLLAAFVAGDISGRGRIAFIALLAVGSAVRLETMFVGAGCAAALLVATLPRFAGPAVASRWTARRRLLDAAAVAVAATVPVLVIGGVDRAFGRHFFPNSVVAKTALGTGDGMFPGWAMLLERMTTDALLGLLLLLAVAYLVFVWNGSGGAHAAFATAFAVAGVLHVTFASVGWYERYQAYLLALGLYLVLAVVSEVVVPRWREATLGCLAIALVVLSGPRVGLLTNSPLASSNTYRQQYQLGRFMDRYYDGEPIAVQDLGYVAQRHDGPVLDFNGLGSHEVLDLLRDGDFDKQAMRDLVRRHRVEAIALYANAYLFRLPDE